MSNWQKYESHKVVRAAKIVWVGLSLHAEIVIAVEPEEGSPREYFEPTVPGMKEKAEVGGWAVLYPDGFKSISPAKAFEDGYTLMPEQSI